MSPPVSSMIRNEKTVQLTSIFGNGLLVSGTFNLGGWFQVVFFPRTCPVVAPVTGTTGTLGVGGEGAASEIWRMDMKEEGRKEGRAAARREERVEEDRRHCWRALRGMDMMLE